MADVTKIPGPVPNEPTRGSREAAKPGTDKFKDLMKVDKSGEREKKKNKRQEESEEDTKAELSSTAATPDKHVESKKAEKFAKIQKVGESEKRQPQQQKRSEEASALDEAAAANINRQKIESINLDQVQSTTLEKKGAAGTSYTGELSQQEEAVEEKVHAVEKKEAEETVSIRKQAKKETAVQQAAQAITPASTALGPLFIAPAPQTTPAYMLLNGEMMVLFEKMVSQIFIMQANGLNETTIHLDGPEFASSKFAGTQIVIREFSTAPLVFNIEFLGTPQNAALFEQNFASLRAAFTSENRSYTINRMESHLLSKAEKPHFHRKEKTSDKEKK